MNEAEKYQEVWEHDEYRGYSPGESYVWMFLEMLKEHNIKMKGKLAEIGCGTGRAGLILNNFFEVHKYDITSNCLDEFVPKTNFHVLDICKEPLPKHNIGYCCDVMEHMPTEYVMTVLNNIAKSCNYAFFSICTKPDHFGKLVGEDLHLTVKPYTWWRDKLGETRGNYLKQETY